MSPQLLDASKKARPISEGLVQKTNVVGNDAGKSVSDGDNVKSKTIDLNEAVSLPVITPEPIRDGNRETPSVVDDPGDVLSVSCSGVL